MNKNAGRLNSLSHGVSYYHRKVTKEYVKLNELYNSERLYDGDGFLTIFGRAKRFKELTKHIKTPTKFKKIEDYD